VPTKLAKIIATWGPAVASDELITRLINAGVDLFRLNFSHANHDEIAEVVPRIRAPAAAAGRPIALLQDIQGPRIRTGLLPDGKSVALATGSIVGITPDVPGSGASATAIHVTYPRFADDVAVGHRVLIADGTIILRAVEVANGLVRAEVPHGGALGEHKGVNLPDSAVSAEPLTDKDVADLAFGAEIDVDYVALSFVRRASDVEACRAILTGLGRTTPVISKIEHPLAIDNLEEILAVSDGVMVARGDLGVEVSPERVPLLQKHIIHRANEVGIPVITATQMLDSMIERPIPTRAEASDVANAILDGTDAIMLSGETAIGAFPVETVETMARIAIEAESAEHLPARFHRHEQAYLIAQSAVSLATSLNAHAILVFTRSGTTGKTVSLYRPGQPVYALTPDPVIAGRLALWYAVTPIVSDDVDDLDEMIAHGIATLRERNAIASGDTIVFMGSSPIGPPNFINVRVVPS
jgi:pyruvate kinase